MATVTETRYTPEDLLTITDRPMPELVDGQLVERAMGQEADAIGVTIISLLVALVRPGKLGLVNGAECGYQIFPDDPGKVRIPDVSFTRRERMSPKGPAEGHSRIAPDLVVEVISRNDNAGELFAKIADYLAAGVRLIWVVNPKSKSVAVWRGDGTGSWLTSAGVLDGEDVLPGFTCPVASIFE